MKNILILGAGKSSAVLIKYLSDQAVLFDWNITVADQEENNAKLKTAGLSRTNPMQFNADKPEALENLIKISDIVLSMLPPFMHFQIAKNCVKHKKPLITASYITDDIASLNDVAKENGIPILMEMGLDPGIDHMSAMQEIHQIKKIGGEIISFKSYTGGLVAPQSDNNPWNYKITWNPRNVVLAGQGIVKYLAEGSYKYIPYQSVFERLENFHIESYGNFEGYANRDSLKYLATYDLENIHTFIRGTLRRPGYCSAWNAFVKLGLTDDSFIIENSNNMTYKQFISSFLPESTDDLKNTFYAVTGLKRDYKFDWLGIFDNDKIKIANGTPAQILQEIIETKWVLSDDDKDMIVMQHEFIYTLESKTIKRIASMVDVGLNKIYTSMAKTVGLPMGIAAKLLLNGELKISGVQIPVTKNIYEPILKELEMNNIRFNVKEFII